MGKSEQIKRPAIITDALLRKSLAAVRSLGSKGVPVYAADTTRLTPAGLSSHCERSLNCPSPMNSPEAYEIWLEETLERLPGAIVFPMDDASMQIALGIASHHFAGSFALLPGAEAFGTASDKYATVRAAEAAGIECPRTWLPQREEDLAGIAAAEAGLPLVIKPRSGSGSRGIRIARSTSELTMAYREASAVGQRPMIQQYIPPGERYDAAVLFDADGEPVATFAQRELRHYPADIGPSTAQESVWMPELVDDAIRLLRGLEWRGIAEVEWMRDPRDGRLKLMEINPRYWNSLHLAIQSGVDFPYLHYRLSLGERLSPQHTYRVGQITRNLLPGDLLHAMSVGRLRGLDPPLIGRGRRPVEDDIWSWRDPMATVGFACSCARFMLDRRMWAALFKR